MTVDRPIPAQTAARLLGRPEQARTFMRRAQEALDAGDERVYRVGRQYMAPLGFWRGVRLRPAGRPPNDVVRSRRSFPIDEEGEPPPAAPRVARPR